MQYRYNIDILKILEKMYAYIESYSYALRQGMAD